MADDPGGETTYTQDELDKLVAEKLAEAKAEGDKAFKNLWNEAKEAKAKLKEIGDPDEVKERLARLQELETEKEAGKKGLTAEEIKKIRADVRADLEREYEPVKAKLEALESDNRKLRLDDRVKTLMAKAGARPERIDALYKLTAEEYDLTDDGEPMVREKPGTPVDKYISDEVAKQYPELFVGSGSNGGGASKSASGAGGNPKRIAADDEAAWNANLEQIAKGEIEVVLD